MVYLWIASGEVISHVIVVPANIYPFHHCWGCLRLFCGLNRFMSLHRIAIRVVLVGTWNSLAMPGSAANEWVCSHGWGHEWHHMKKIPVIIILHDTILWITGNVKMNYMCLNRICLKMLSVPGSMLRYVPQVYTRSLWCYQENFWMEAWQCWHIPLSSHSGPFY